ncbi:MAG: hypothetical protein KU38_06285 [Sulfurovum sp. FS08-3]|nr:MAG: hypothetical protein KU38_06285 [Sulfurovum sp. FS08-3]
MFDKEELEILEALENDTIKRSIDANGEIALAKRYAKEHLSKSKNITIRINGVDLEGIKSKSRELGIPYQTLINALIHQYATDKIKLSV